MPTTQNYYKIKHGLEVPSQDAIQVTDSTGPSVRPSLLLDFAKTKTLDPRITYNRSSTATYYDGKSVVKAEENLCLYSQSFASGGWGGSPGYVTFTNNQGTAPDGTNTATLVTAVANTSFHETSQTILALAGAPYTYSIYLKPGTHKYVYVVLQIRNNNTYVSNLVSVSYDLSTLEPNNNVYSENASIVFAGNGWYRIIITATFPTSGANQICPIFGFDDVAAQANITLNGTENFYVWGAQVEQRAYATAYIPTTTSPVTNYIPAMRTAASGSPRFTHNPTTLECVGLSMEEQRTNLVIGSSAFEATPWVAFASVISANATAAPDGTFTAAKITETTTTQGHTLYQGIGTISGSYAVSAYFKAAGRATGYIQLYSTGGNAAAFFDLSAGTITSSSGTTSITPVGNGWYRITAANTFTSAYATLYIVLTVAGNSTYAGDGSSGVYVWGAQVEASAYPTSYIPTPYAFSSRGSIATYRSPDGFLRVAQPNQPRYELNTAGGYNLVTETYGVTNRLTFTEEIGHTGWGFNTAFFGRNVGPAPDGSNTATEVFGGNQSVSLAYVSPEPTTAVIGTGQQTCSIYAKAGTGTSFTLNTYYSGDTEINVTFTLTGNGSTDSASISSITPVGGGWYRCVVFNPARVGSGTTFNFRIWPSPRSGSNRNSVILWGPQLESGNVVTSYIPSVETHTGRSTVGTYFDASGTLRSADASVPRYTHNPRNLRVPPKLLIEAAATNAILNTDTTTQSATISTGTATGPDGVLAYKVVPNAGAVSYPGRGNNASQFFNVTTTAGQVSVYTFSGYFSSIGPLNYSPYIVITASTDISSNQLYALVRFNPSNGTFTNKSFNTGFSELKPPVAVKHPRGMWYVTWTVMFTQQSTVRNKMSCYFQIMNENGTTVYTADGSSGVQYACMQFEEGYAATSYIPTTTSQVTRAADTATSASSAKVAEAYTSTQVTRAADTASMTGTNFSSWFNLSEGTFYIDSTYAYDGSPTYPRILGAVGTNFHTDEISLYYSSVGVSPITAGFVNSAITINGAQTAGSSPVNQTVRGRSKAALAYKTNDMICNADGLVGNYVSNTPLPVVQELRIFGIVRYQPQPTGTIKRIIYYPKRLSDSEVLALTSQ